MQSNYITRGCAVCVTTAAMSDQHRGRYRETVTLHTHPCKAPQTDSHTHTKSISGKLLKTTRKIERTTPILQRFRPENGIIF